MTQNTQSQPLKHLSDLTRQLAEVIDLKPIESMDEQLKQQQAQRDSNIVWLDKASQLLEQVCQLDNSEQQTQQLITAIEQFIANSRDAEAKPLAVSNKLDGIYIPRGDITRSGDKPIKNQTE